MDRRIALLFLSLTLFTCVQAQGCNFPFSWYSIGATNFWWEKYFQLQGNGNELLLYSFNTSFMSNVIAPEHFQCENSDGYSSNEFTYAAMRRLNSNKRFCFEAYRFDDVIMFRKTIEIDRNSAYTRDQCISSLESRVAWNLWVRYPFTLSTPASLNQNLPGLQGTFQLSYREGAVDILRCDGITSSTATVSGNQFITNSCNNQGTFERPLRTTLFIVATATDEQVDPAGLMANPPEGGFMALAYTDDAGSLNLYNYYCAKYTMMPGFMQIVFSVEIKDWAKCVSDAEFLDQEVRDNNKYLTFELRTEECSTSNPCVNGGTCLQGWQEFTCLCLNGYTGSTCAQEIDQCFPNPCQNQGLCFNKNGVGFECTCPNGFTGDTCEVVDACGSSPCDNGATCVNVPVVDGGYACICTQGFIGRNCEKADVCVQQSISCQNGGTCFSDGTDFVCKCPTGYSGVLCETNGGGDPCDPWPCLNGGTCLPNGQATTYTCTCPPNYFGTNCETNIPPVTPTPGGLCDGQIVCENGGQCYTSGTEYLCECTSYWDGEYCTEWTDWFIAAIVLIALLLLILLILLILCLCYCCCGWRAGAREEGSLYSETRTLDGHSSIAPSTVQFNLSPPSPYYGIKVMDR